MDMIDKFCHSIRFYSNYCEGDVIMEPCSNEKRAKMYTFDEPSGPYFYVHLKIIHNLQVLILFTSYKTDFLTTINISPSQITPNMWDTLREF